MATVALTLKSSTAVRYAPCPVFLDCIQASTGWNGTGQPKWVLATVRWTCEETGVYLIDDPRPGYTTQHDLSTDAQGFNWGYVFNTPGVWDVTVDVEDENGVTYQDTVGITIGDRGGLFNEYYLDATTGNDSAGADGSLSQPWRTFGYAQTRLAAGDTLNAKRGDTYTETVRFIPNLANLVVQAYGSGADPIYLFAGTAPPQVEGVFVNGGENSVTKNIECRSAYLTSADLLDAFGGGTNIAYVDCTVQSIFGGNGFGECFRFRGGTNGCLVLRCTAGNPSVYVNYQGSSDQLWVGLSVPDGFMSIAHRMHAGVTRRTNYLWCNYIKTGNPYAAFDHTIRQQETQYVHVYQSYFYGCWSTIGFDEDYCTQSVWDGNHMVAYDGSSASNECLVVSMGTENVGIRNNYFVFDNGKRGVGIVSRKDGNLSNPIRGQINDVYIEGNTIVSQHSGHKAFIYLYPYFEEFASVDTAADTITVQTPYNSSSAGGPVYSGTGNWINDGYRIRFWGSQLPSPLSEGVNYWVVNAAKPVFQVSLTQGGAPVDLTDTGGVSKKIFPLSVDNLVVKNNLLGGTVDKTERIVGYTSLGSLVESENNVYPAGAVDLQNGRTDYSVTNWNAESWATNEVQEDVPLAAFVSPDLRPDSTLYPLSASSGQFINGMKYDYHGNERPPSTPWYVGAVDAETGFIEPPRPKSIDIKIDRKYHKRLRR